MNTSFELVAFIFCLCCSAFFSGTETAFFSLSPLRLRKLEDEGDKRVTSILEVLSDKQRLLTTLLLGNVLVNVIATAIATRFILGLVAQSQFLKDSVFGNSQGMGVVIASAIMTIVLLVFGEITPKTIAIFSAHRFARVAVIPLRLIITLATPVTLLVAWFLKTFFSGYSDWNRKLGSATSLDEIDSYFSLGEEVGIIERSEKEMISSVFEFGETLVREVMIPRPDIVAVPANIQIDPLLKLVRDDGHSRFPVFDGALDKVIGILYVKDLLVRYDEIKNSFDLSKLTRAVYFVPETKKLDDLLREFQKRKIHMALVVDEFGGISGLVTIEDLLEEIVGEIVDEYDQEEPSLCVKQGDNVFNVDAKMSIKDLESELGLEFQYEDSETVGGFVLEKLGRIPKREERWENEHALFIVSELKGNRILRVLVTKKEMVLPSETASPT